MIRLFENHTIRKQKELEGLWDFTLVESKNTFPDKYEYKLMVPGCIESDVRFCNYRGCACYKKTINIENISNLRLVFKGVSHSADVYFDKKHIAHHYNAYTEFSTIIKNVNKGIHEIIVFTDNRFSKESALHKPNDYYTYGGIIRPIVLQEIDDIYIENIKFTPFKKNNKWNANIQYIIENTSNIEKRIRISSCLENMEMDIIDSKNEFSIGANEKININISHQFDDVKNWSLDDPKLYLLNSKLYVNGSNIPSDDLIERIGFREIIIEDNDILLNGKKVFLKGFNRHEDFAKVGCSLSMQHMNIDMGIIKDLNTNAIRTSHYPNDERFLDMCDENGILIWEENHARGLSYEDMKNPNFEKQCKDCIDEMIQNHYNHPSIIIWAILNECASGNKEAKAMYKKQIDQIRSLDHSRPVTYASCAHFTDLCFDLVDIISVNLYYGWYGEEKNKEEILESYLEELEWIKSTNNANKPIIISEFGAGAIYGYRTFSRAKWSEERQSDILSQTLSVYMNRTEISGCFIWQFSDCRVTDEIWGINRPRTHNNKGIVDEYRRAKLSYNTVKEKYSNS